MYIKFEEISSMSDQIRMMTGDDTDTFLDTLDGETDVMDILGKLLQERAEASIYETSTKELAATYNSRAKRLANRQSAISITIGQLLDAMGEKKVQHPLATISRTKARWSVSITDADQIPTQLMNVTTKPDLAAIKKQMDQGEIVPGCEISPGQPSITVRIK
tara:strand:+ start:61 stop:546 length:486 start_codon:yes stop_codon:yes gene_type:complete